LIKEKIETSSKLFTEIVKTPLLVYDLATIDNAVDNFLNIGNVMGVQIFDSNGREISHKHNDSYTHKNILETTIDGRIFRLKSLPITIEGEVIGNVHIVYEITNSFKAIEDNRNFTLTLVLVEILLSILTAYIIGFRLTRSLGLLTSSAEQIAHNDQVIIPSFKNSSNEIAVLADTLHFMQERIAQRNKELKTDVKKLKKAQKDIDRYVKLIDEHVLISHVDLNGKFTNNSKAYCRLSGYSNEELKTKDYKILKDPKTSSALYKELWRTIKSGKVWYGEIKNIAKDGHMFWVYSSIYPDFDENDTIIGYYAIREDITNKKIVEKLSITDALTQLYNRRHFDDIFDKEIKKVRRDKKIFCLLSLDVDNFKLYNDNYGHQAGDIVLSSIAIILKENMKRASDYAFRIGGEEFSAIYSVDNEKSAFGVAQKINTLIEEEKIEHKFNPVSPYVTVSIGITFVDFGKNINAETDKSILYKFTDDLLYRAKESGRNRVVCKEF